MKNVFLVLITLCFGIIGFNYSYADEELQNEVVRTEELNRSPAIDGPATAEPTGEQAHLYQHLFSSHQETDTNIAESTEPSNQ